MVLHIYGTLLPQTNTDLVVEEYGTEKCEPGHYFGPAIKESHMLHYIHKGRGIYCVNGKTYNLTAGQVFFIVPHERIYYEADKSEPWEYTWVGFMGTKATWYLNQCGLTGQTPVVAVPAQRLDDAFRNLITGNDMLYGREIFLIGTLYLILSYMIAGHYTDLANEKQSTGEYYVNKALDFISMNYTRDLKISEVAAHVRLDRAYLSSLFHKLLSTSPKEYLTHYRMEKACALLNSTNLSIGDIARSVGYNDQFLFSRIFKRYALFSPQQFRDKGAMPGAGKRSRNDSKL